MLVDRDEAVLAAVCEKHGNAVIPLGMALLDSRSCATLVMRKAGQIDVGSCQLFSPPRQAVRKMFCGTSGSQSFVAREWGKHDGSWTRSIQLQVMIAYPAIFKPRRLNCRVIAR